MKKENIPTTQQLESELRRLRQKEIFSKTLLSTVSSLTVIAAIAVIISNMIFPVLRVSGTSMTPTLNNDEIVICSKLGDFRKSDIIAFYYNNKILLKRVIGTGGDVINISEDGKVTVNDEVTDESYTDELALGECDIEFPYRVPDNRVFVMGDHRAVSIDSRSSSVGCIAEENIIGKVFFRIMPFSSAGAL